MNYGKFRTITHEKLQIITLSESEKWDEVVKSFKNYDVTYLSGYAKAFQLSGEGEPLLFYYVDSSTRGINVVMKRDIAKAKPFINNLPLNTWFDVSTPYGYGGFLLEGDNYEGVNNAFNSYCIENGIVSEFVRFNLFSGFESYYTGVVETNTHNIVRYLDLPLDAMLMDFEHKVRKSLKKAEKAELKVEIDNTGSRLEDFLEIYYGTMDRNNADDRFFFTKEFLKKLIK
ncbi:hypothetical protein ACI2OX_19450 [Bacillus sp. N9]